MENLMLRQILEAFLRTRQERFPKPELCRSTNEDIDIEIGEVYRSVSYQPTEPTEPEELEIEKLDI
jgi:hypothetical protein